MLEEITYLDIEDFIQTLTSKRNIAIHQGVSLHTIFSIEKLENLSNNLEVFLKTINDILNFSLNFYKNKCELAYSNILNSKNEAA